MRAFKVFFILFLIAALLVTFKDDAEADTALVPDAVAVPGITCEVTGF